MSSLNRVSTLIDSQLPEFIRSDYPVFVEFLEKYYEFLEQPGNPVYELKTFSNNYDIDLTRESLLKYFRTKILPSFPEESELSTERIIKSARDFYTKKGTPESFQFLFRVLYNKDLDIYFPKLQVFKASDGKWVQPQAFRLTSSIGNQSVNLNLLKGLKGVGSVSKATCIVERAYKTIDLATNSEIYEVYVSSITRTFNNNEFLEIQYVDENGNSQIFRETIIGSLSNIRINPRRRGKRYYTGDPVVISGGQNLNSLTRQKAVATVGNVSVSILDNVTVVKRGYGFRTTPNTYIDIITKNPYTGAFDGTGNGAGANAVVSGVDTTTANTIKVTYSSDGISLKADTYLYENDMDFANSSFTTLFYANAVGSTQTTVNLSSRPSVNTTNDYYNNYVIKVVEGTGSNGLQSRINTVVISDYYGSNGMAVVNTFTPIVGTVNVSGINVTANLSEINKANFTAGMPGFYTYLTSGKDIEVNGEVRTIDTVTNADHLTVTSAFSAPAYNKTLNANSTLSTTLDATSYLQLTTSLDSRIGGALSFESFNLYPIISTSVVTGGGGYEDDLNFNVISLYESDLSSLGFVNINPGEFYAYNTQNASLRFSSDFSALDDYYVGRRIKIDNHFRKITDYDGATRTVFLERPFENNITSSNILNKRLQMDNRPLISTMGIIAAIEILNGGTGYANNDPIYFYGTGVGAAAQVEAVNISGTITKIKITNRGEGYVSSPNAIVGGTGSGANLNVVLLGDGEELTSTISSRGEIIDFVLSNRGSDYISKPNVSLKIYDLYVTGNTTNIAAIKENDIVYQGTPSNKTFTGTVDNLYSNNTILRVFDYSGAPDVNVANIVITRANSTGVYLNVHNTGVTIANANVNGIIYPRQYGNGRAKANVEFLNGLIRYNGFYLNSDGHASSDQHFQDNRKFHNYSYSLYSEESYDTYKKTVFDTIHPTGTKLLPIHIIPESYSSEPGIEINTHAIVLSTNSFIGKCSITYNSTTVAGSGSEVFDTIANVGDMIVVNSSDTKRFFVKTITSIANNNSLNIESPCTIIGEGRAHISAGNASIVIKGNTNAVSSFIDTSDQIKLNIDGTLLIKTINVIFGNVVTLNSNTGITNTTNLTIDTTSATNYGKQIAPALVYEIIPQFSNVDYEIIRT